METAFDIASLFTFPRDPQQRHFTLEELFDFAYTRVTNAGLERTLDALINVITEALADGTLVETIRFA